MCAKPLRATPYAPWRTTKDLHHLLGRSLETIADARGRPRQFGEETGIAGLYFVGFKNPATGALREIAIEAPRVAQSIRRVSDCSLSVAG